MTKQPTTKPILPSDSGVHCIDIPKASDVTVLAVEYSTARPDLRAGWIFANERIEDDGVVATVAVRRSR